MLEDGANQVFARPAEPHEIAAVSIAISLKRIADALTEHPGPRNLYDMLNDITHNTMPVSR